MTRHKIIAIIAAGCAGLVLSQATRAADFSRQTEGDFIARDFAFKSGEKASELRLHYTTLGDPANAAVLVLHGTSGSGTSLLTPAFGGALFGPGQPLDAQKYFIILPDAIGHGKSAKPSDGLRAKFPRYTYDDMVEAQYRLVTEGLKVRHAHVVLGFSMGGMNAWMWGTAHPDFMDILVPMASQPAAMSSRNWMMRRLVIDAVRNDPDWKNGDYKEQPRMVRTANVFYGIATNGGTQAYQKMAPTREAADKVVDDRLAAPFTIDANDMLYQYEASRFYDPSSDLGRITARVLAINSADDERNPPETGIMARELAKIAGAKLFVVPASPETTGHGTVLTARFWSAALVEALAPK